MTTLQPSPMTPSPTIETAIRVLNEAFAADPVAINALLCNVIPCNAALAQHPTVQVRAAEVAGRPDLALVGVLGLLNGVLEPMTGQRVAAFYGEPNAAGHAVMLGFGVYPQPS